MTIKGLWEYYKAKVGLRRILASSLRGCRIAVDASAILFHPLRYVAKKNYLRTINPLTDPIDEADIDRRWLKMVLKRIIEHLQDGIVPVIVLDGPRHPLKAVTGAARAATEAKSRAAFATLVATGSDDTEQAIKHLTQSDVVPQASKDKFRRVVESLGLPYVVSTSEAERTCALMNRDGVVAAGFTSDSDFMAFGGLVQLKDKCIVSKNSVGWNGFETAAIQPLLDSLEVDFRQFQEICIMSGTDFNQSIRMLSWGGAVPAIKQYGSIYNFGVCTGRDVSCLNADEVYREMFQIVPWWQTVSEQHLEFAPECDTSYFAGWGADAEVEEFLRWRAEIIAPKPTSLPKRALKLPQSDDESSSTALPLPKDNPHKFTALSILEAEPSSFPAEDRVYIVPFQPIWDDIVDDALAI